LKLGVLTLLWFSLLLITIAIIVQHKFCSPAGRAGRF
jgi:hypothetical protein